MAAMARVGLDIQVYLGNGKFWARPTSSIRIYTSAEQRDDKARSLIPDTFVLSVTVERGVHYAIQGVSYKSSVAIPFIMCQESADSCSIVRDDEVICLQGAQMSEKIFEIHSNIMESVDDILCKNNLLLEEMDVEQGHSLWDGLCVEIINDPQFPKDPDSEYQRTY